MDPKNALEVPDSITSLNIKGSEWESVRARWSEFKKLESLRIERGDFDRFPEMVYDLPVLRSLLLLDGRIGQFPLGISKMRQLRWIKLSRMAIPVLPTDLGKVPALQLMQLEGLALGAFPVEQGEYSSLEQLELTSCELPILPDEVGRLPQLRALTVSGNPITQIPSSLATGKKLESLYADGCRLERIPEELFSLPALQRIDLTGNTFPKDAYEALDRLAKSHPKVEVLMPRVRRSRPSPSVTTSGDSLSKSVEKELIRLGFEAPGSVERLRELDIAGTRWPVPPAIGELLAHIRSRSAILVPVLDDDLQRLDLSYQPSVLDEHECIHHHPYVAIGMTATYFFVVLRLDDDKPGDPQLYVIDSEDYTTHEAGELVRLSVWLKRARPAER